jgi:ribosomal protein S27E
MSNPQNPTGQQFPPPAPGAATGAPPQPVAATPRFDPQTGAPLAAQPPPPPVATQPSPAAPAAGSPPAPGAATGAPAQPPPPTGPPVAPAPVIVNTDSGLADGLNKCPRCGSPEIVQQPGSGKLQCQYCRHVFDPPQLTAFQTSAELVGEVIGSGASNITQPDNTQVTIKCQGCGAEVVIDINASMTSRCHWCRQTLSIEHQMPNGAVPDLVLPFYLGKEQARASIEAFVSKRTFFAHPRFKREFTTENIIGVYLPYLVVDVRGHSDLRGKAGHIVKERPQGKNDTVYDIDIYDVGRDFDFYIDNLTVEASSERRDVDGRRNTNNVINTILPFDLENAVPYNGNYLKGFNSERRDTNIDQLRDIVGAQVHDVSRYKAKQTATAYTAGIRWESEDLKTYGLQWKAAYLPVWLYSYYQDKGGGNYFLHYVAVNARTGETMGSVPMNMGRLFLVSALIETVALVLLGGLAAVLFIT